MSDSEPITFSVDILTRKQLVTCRSLCHSEVVYEVEESRSLTDDFLNICYELRSFTAFWMTENRQCRTPLVTLHYFTSSNVTANPVRSCMVPEVMIVSP